MSIEGDDNRPSDYNDDSNGKTGEKSISFQLIVKKHLPRESTLWPQDKVVESLNKITHLRLDREDLSQIDNLELLGDNLTNIYLQMNRISRIENMECVKNVQFLTLSSNKIQKLEGLSTLEKLIFLDLSHNHIKYLDLDELPPSLAILNMEGNPCTQGDGYRSSVIQALPRLRQLDEQEVTLEERRLAGYDVSSEDEDEEEDESDTQRDTLTSQDIFSMASAEILLRSQDRMEGSLLEHKDRRSFLSNLRTSSAVTAAGGATREIRPS